MLIFRLCNFIRGYVVINLNIANYEKTLNLLRRKGINMWDIEKLETGISFKISYNDYKKYCELIDDSNMQLVKKTGFAFKYNKIKVRKGFSAGIIILILCLFVFANVVWNIEVIGANQTLSKEIVSILKDNNISMPSTATSLNNKHIETIIHKNFDELKFVEAYIEGSKLIIFVKEKELEHSAIEENTPSSIISSKNAVINKIIAKSGQTVVRVGDVVYEGQTLIMGIVKNKNSDEFVMVPSYGTIYGKTYYNFELKEEKVKNITISTNNEKKAYYLKINDKNIKIIGDTKPFEIYNYNESIIKLPVISKLTNSSIVKGKYYEEKVEAIKIDENTAKNKMKVSMYDNLLGMVNSDSKILNTSLNFQEDEKYYYLSAQLEVVEDIGKKIRIFPVLEENKTEEKTQ